MFRVILMCLLSCCSSFMPLKQSESNICEDHTQVVEKKIRSNFYQEGEYFVIGCTELIDIDTLNYIFRDTPSFFTTSTVGSTYSMFEYLSDTRLVGFNVYNPTLSDLGYSNGLSVDVFNFELTGYRDDFNYCKMQSWKLNIKHSSTPTINMSNTFYLSYNNSSSNTSLVSMQVSTSLVGTYGNYLIVSKNQDFKNVFIEKYYNASYNSGYHTGYEEGYGTGYDEGVERGKEIALDPASEIYDLIFNAGYQEGFQNGVDETIASGNEAMIIFSGIMDVAFIPVNVFFLMFNYEVFGINIAGFVSGLITIAIVIIIFKFILGRKV